MSQKDFDELFYLSLFEAEHFFTPYFQKYSSEIRKNIEDFIKKRGEGPWKKKPQAVNYFLTGRVCNLIISFKLSKKLRKKVTSYKIRSNKKILVELDGWIEKLRIVLEIKRMVTTAQIGDYLKEIIDKSKKINKLSAEKEYNHLRNSKILGIFIFICENEEEKRFFEKIIPGFRNLFQLLKDSKIISENVEFLMIPYTRKSSLENFINILSVKIKNIIEKNGEYNAI